MSSHRWAYDTGTIAHAFVANTGRRYQKALCGAELDMVHAKRQIAKIGRCPRCKSAVEKRERTFKR